MATVKTTYNAVVKYMVPRGYCFDNWTFVDGEVSESIFEVVHVRGGKFSESTINNCIFKACVFSGVYFNEMSFYGSVFKGVVFMHCHINSSFYDGSFINCKFINCVFEDRTELNVVLMPNCVFDHCQFKGHPTVAASNRLSFIDCENPPYVPMACPTEGKFKAYKCAVATLERDARYKKLCIVHICIPFDAKRSSAFGRKCRANRALIMGIEGLSGEKLDPSEYYIVSLFDNDYIYRVGDVIAIDDFDEDRWKECAPGFHFFMTKEEARDYCII